MAITLFVTLLFFHSQVFYLFRNLEIVEIPKKLNRFFEILLFQLQTMDKNFEAAMLYKICKFVF